METAITKHTATLVEIRADQKTYPRISRMTREQAVAGLTIIIQKAAMYRGNKAEATTVAFTAGALYDELMADTFRVGTSNICLEEIDRAVKREVLTNRDMYGVNVASLYPVIVEYCKKEAHAAQMELNRQIESRQREEFRQRMEQLSPMIDTAAGKMIRRNRQ